MTPTRRDVLRSAALLTVSGTLAGCSSGSGDDPTTGGAGAGGDSTTEDGTEATSTVTPTATPSATSGPTVAVREHPEYGEILVDGEGMTLYLFTRDSRGESVCSGDCADAWPPLTGGNPSAGDRMSASLDTIERDDGSMQVTADGLPLYYYAPDSEPGEATGHGVGDVWYVLRPDGSAVRPDRSTVETTDTTTSSPTPTGPAVRLSTHPDLGEILTDGDGRTLYLFTRDTAGETPTCTDSCAENWPPLTGGQPQAGDGVTASLGRIERPDGSMQVTADGMPLYYFAGDGGPGDVSGQGVGDVWYVLRPDGSVVQASATTATPTPSPTPTDEKTTSTPTPTTTDDSDGGGDGGYY